MAQTNLTIRIDEDIKYDAENLFKTLGMSMSGAVNIFFRQAVRERAIPFPIRAKTAEEEYDEYFTPENVESIKRGIAQAERGETISFTLDEFDEMAAGKIPQRAYDFLAKYKQEPKND
jgi:DNA-damage-inducible protein J